MDEIATSISLLPAAAILAASAALFSPFRSVGFSIGLSDGFSPALAAIKSNRNLDHTRRTEGKKSRVVVKPATEILIAFRLVGAFADRPGELIGLSGSRRKLDPHIGSFREEFCLRLRK